MTSGGDVILKNRGRYVHRRRQSWSKGLVAGIVAGAVGSWVMDAFQTGVGKLQSALKDGGQSEMDGKGQQDAHENEPATVKAAVAISHHIFHHELKPEQKPVAGSVIHYVFGSLVGAGYGLLAEYWPA